MVGVAREEATHKVTGLLQEEDLDNQVLVDRLDSYIVLNCHMVEVVVVAVVPASRSTVLKNMRSQSWCVRPAAEAVGVALRNTQEAENPQARLGVMAVGEWVTLGQTAHMRSQSDSWCVRPAAEVVGVAR